MAHNHEWERAFLAALSACPNVAGACKLSGVTRRAAYAHRAADPEFAAAWDDAIEHAVDELAGDAWQRARGAEADVRLTIFLLKAHRRELYGDRQDITSGGRPIGSLPAALAALSDADLAALESIGEKLDAGPGGDA